MKLDRTKSFATVYGHESASFQQGDVLFGGDEMALEALTPAAKRRQTQADKDDTIPTDDVTSAKVFLTTILKGGPVSKSAVFKEAESNNQSWAVVTTASADMGIVKFQVKGQEMWKLQAE